MADELYCKRCGAEAVQESLQEGVLIRCTSCKAREYKGVGNAISEGFSTKTLQEGQAGHDAPAPREALAPVAASPGPIDQKEETMKGDEAIGERVRELRQKQGLTLRDVVFKVDNVFSITELSTMETGKKAFPDEALVRIAEALGTTVEYLKTGMNGIEAPVPELSHVPERPLDPDEPPPPLPLDKARYIAWTSTPAGYGGVPYESLEQIIADIQNGLLIFPIITRRLTVRTRVEIVEE